MEKIRKFNLENDYLNVNKTFEYPTVSYTEDTEKVWIMDKPQSYFIGTFETTKENEIKMYANSWGTLTSVKDVYLDDVLVDKCDYSGVLHENGNYINIPTIGTHTVKCIMDEESSDLSHLFRGLVYNTLDVTHLNVSNVTYMTDMFTYLYPIKKLDLSTWDTSNVTNMTEIFSEMLDLEELILPKNFGSKSTDISYMFKNCEKLKNVNLENIITSAATDMRYMFSACYNLTSLDLSSFDTSNVTSMYNMFGYCDKLTSLDLSSFDTSKVTDMTDMFEECSGLTSLDLSHFNTSKVTKFGNMFRDCNNLTSITFGYNANVNNVNVGTFDDDMFKNISPTCILTLCNNTKTSWETLLSKLSVIPTTITYKECTE